MSFIYGINSALSGVERWWVVMSFIYCINSALSGVGEMVGGYVCHLYKVLTLLYQVWEGRWVVMSLI